MTTTYSITAIHLHHSKSHSSSMAYYRKYPDGTCNHQIGFSIHDQSIIYSTTNRNRLMESAKNFCKLYFGRVSRKRLESLFRLRGNNDFAFFFRYCPVCGAHLRNPKHLVKGTNHFKNYKKS